MENSFDYIIKDFVRMHHLEYKYHFDEKMRAWIYVFTNPRTRLKWSYAISDDLHITTQFPSLLAHKLLRDMPKELYEK